MSFRLTEDERRRLDSEAKGTPLGVYVKAKILGDPPLRLRRSGLPVEDKKSLAKVLALLRNSRLASNLNQLAKLAHIGALPVTEDVGAELREAAADVRIMRDCLFRALGFMAAP